MNAAHTKGPWLFKRHTESNRTERRIVAPSAPGFEDGEALLCDREYYPWNPENDADWHLIAAGPDMLAVLQTIVRVADGRGWSGNLILDENSPLIDAARDAIAKATGVTA